MEHKYKFYIVIDGVEHAIEMSVEKASEQETQDFLIAMRDTKGLWIGLESGDMIAINEYVSMNVYFKAKRIVEDNDS